MNQRTIPASLEADVFPLGYIFHEFVNAGAHPFENGPDILSNIMQNNFKIASKYSNFTCLSPVTDINSICRYDRRSLFSTCTI
jgi:hypothetical protein